MEVRLVGREREFAVLRDRDAAARAGHGAVALVAGEAGIGKTTLIERFRRSVTDGGQPVLAGRAMADEGVPALWPWRRLLTDALADARLDGLTPDLLDAGTGADAALDPAAARFQAIDRTVAALRTAAEPAGLVLMLEDLHWADDASLLLLRHLCGEVAGSRILVVGTFRDPDRAVGLPAPLVEVCGMSTVETLRLGPVSPADVAALLTAAGPVHPTWPAHVHRRTGGNPLFVRELTRVLAQHGVLGEPAHDLPLPMELRRLVGYRLSRLSADCQRLLGVCSAIGDEIDVALLEAVEDGLDIAVLAEAVAAGVLVEDPESPATMRFSHAVVREARYESLSRAARLAVHRRLADVSEAAGERARHRVQAAVDPASRHAAALACREAARAATGRRAVEEALRWYRQAVELWQGDGDTDGVARAGLLVDAAGAAYSAGLALEALALCERAADLADRFDRPDLLTAAALVVRGIGGEVNAGVLRLCERALATGTGDDTVRAQLLAQQAFALSEVDSPAAAEPYSAEALALAEASGDPGALLAALHARHQVLNVPSDRVAERLALGSRMLALAASADRQIYPKRVDLRSARNPDRPEAALWGHIWRIEAQFQLGAVEELDKELRELEHLAERLGWPVAWWHLRRAQGARATLTGRFDEALARMRQARDLATHLQDEAAVPLYHSQVQAVYQLTGQFADMEPEIIRMALEIPAPISWAVFGPYLHAAGDDAGAAILYERLRSALPTVPYDSRWIAIIAATGQLAVAFDDREVAARCYDLLQPYTTYYLYSASGAYGAMDRILGELAVALDRLDDADRHLGDAVRMEARIGALPFLALAQLAHADLLHRRGGTGDLDKAARLVERAGHTARRLGLAPALARATALAAELTALSRRTEPQLTAREREIAGLLADGLANRAIAERLVLSERTVEAHVRNILAKLGLTNRTQVATWSVRLRTNAPTEGPGA
jgi:DNA-binding CsgD family transcriptional regulator